MRPFDFGNDFTNGNPHVERKPYGSNNSNNNNNNNKNNNNNNNNNSNNKKSIDKSSFQRGVSSSGPRRVLVKSNIAAR